MQLAAGSYGIGVAADTDAAGSTTALVAGYGHGARLFEHPPGGAWSPATPLPGNPAGMAGPVVDAAGTGALGIAWRVDSPRSYTGIAVAMRDPGGTLARADRRSPAPTPAACAIRRSRSTPPATRCWPTTRATAKVHLNMRGAIAIAHRNAGGAFSTPTIVDRTPSSAPAVAMGSDGSGIVAWTHDRRVYASRSAPTGSIGKVKRLRLARRRR